MKIQWTKATDTKSGALTITRSDGSLSYQASTPFFALHDLIHYAVETTLGYQNAFWGHVAQGKGLNDYGTRNGVKDVYSREEIWAETIVGLLQWPAACNGEPLSDVDFFALLQETCAQNGLSIPPVTSAELTQIRDKTRELHERWARVPPGGRLELEFSTSAV